MDQQGILTVVSGFSGAGKGTIMEELVSRYDNYALSVSATTRAPREGEKEGKAYYFKTREEFESMIARDELIEYARYVDQYYGTPKEYVLASLAAGKDVLLEIEVQGALAVKEKFPDAALVFITPPDAAELKRRLLGRGTESAEKIEARLRRAAQESRLMGNYDYILVNDKLEECVEELHRLIQALHTRACCRQDLIKRIQEDMKQFEKGE